MVGRKPFSLEALDEALEHESFYASLAAVRFLDRGDSAELDFDLRYGWVETGADEPVDKFESLTHAVNVLFDDSQVLPDPSKRARVVGGVVYAHEVASLVRVGGRLGSILERRGQSSDREYLDDADWPGVVDAASAALAVMAASEVERADDR